MSKDVKVALVCFSAAGPAIIEGLIAPHLAAGKEYGEDLVNLGFIAGAETAIRHRLYCDTKEIQGEGIGGENMNISPDPWTWIVAICSIAVFSSVFKDNKVYQTAEHVFVGSGAGYALAQAYRNIVIQCWRPTFNDRRWLLIVPLLLGLLMYTRFIKGYEWLSRLSMAASSAQVPGISIYGSTTRSS